MTELFFGSISSNLAKKGADIARDLKENFMDKQIYKYDKEYITGKVQE